VNTNKKDLYYVYFILDEASGAVKIGRTRDLQDRISTLQTGNCNPLELLGTIECKTEDESKEKEKYYHNEFKYLRLLGEWFTYDEETFKKFHKNIQLTESKPKREPLIINTLFDGPREMFGVDNSPRCFFYDLTAQIKNSYEKSLSATVPFRTMVYPTDGLSLLLPYSNEKNKVFISTKKHQENVKLNRYLRHLKNESVRIC
jgi:hypothetical protein